MPYFHVDRTGQCAAGALFGLEERPLQPPELAEVVRELFPNGMTRHGWEYLWYRVAHDSSASKEALLEFVRRAEFPDRPSRFTSIFAFGTLEDAQAFRITYPLADRGISGAICVVEGESMHRANMAVLDAWANNTVAIASARSYWKAERGLARELWEHLLAPPVTVVEVIP